MNECQHCKREYETKSKTSKFCSTSCRVMFNRKKKKGESLKPEDVRTIYNKVVALLEAMPTPAQMAPNQQINQQPVVPQSRFAHYRVAIQCSGSLDELKETMMDVKSDSSLVWKDKQVLEQYAKEISQDLF